MEPILSITTATVLLAIAAAGGLVMAAIRFKGAPRPPSSIAMLHGLLAGAALTLLLYAWFTVGIPGLARAALLFLVVAAAIGIWLNLRFHSQMEPLPIKPIVAHALVAVVGFTLLVLVLLQT
jgi:hypothetical protein